MNRRNAQKSPFIIRTIAVLVLLYCITMLVITLVYARQYRETTGEIIRKQTQEIAEELYPCQWSDPESCEYEDGLNRAQAAAVMRYYQFVKKAELRKAGVTFDAAFYEIKKNRDGSIVRFEEVMPRTPVLTSAPFSKNGKIIVFADVFSKKQMKQLEEILEKDQFNKYIENAKGYREGRFFLPVEIEIGSEGETIRTGYRDDTKKLTAVSFQDIQIIGPGDRRIGGYLNEETEKSSLRKLAEAEMQQDLKKGILLGKGGGTRYASDWKVHYTFHASLLSEHYFVDCQAEAKPMAYAFSRLKGIYLICFILFVFLGGILLGGHNKVIQRQFETEEKRRRMMDSMAHELKTPLGVIKNYGEILMEEENPQRKNEFAEIMVQEADHMNQAVVSMLDLSKMEAGTYPLELSSVSVQLLAEKEAKRIDVLTRKLDIRLELNLQPSERILADEKLVRNILSNFLSNAVTHTKQGGKIILDVYPDGKEIYIGVHNQGDPIPEEDMQRIWSRFYRCVQDRSRQDGGSGLGLAIVRNACLMHGGSYGCKNDADGVTFWARISSMEKKLMKAEFLTGPVIGVIGQGCKLRGLLAMAAGFMIQGICGWDFYGSGLASLLSSDRSWDYIDTFFNVLEAAGILLGGMMILAGAFFLRKELPGGKLLFASSLAAWIVTAGAAGVFRIYTAETGFAETEMMLLVCKLAVFLSWFVISGMVLRGCFLLAGKFHDRRFIHSLIWKSTVYIGLTAGFVILAAAGILWDLSIYYAVNPVLAMVHSFAAYAWIQTCRHYNKRDAANSV